jgi:hypothetical protein
MAFMHAMQSGHTSLESAQLRILDLLAEEAPSGCDWHADLIQRASRPIPGRPAILPASVAQAANETRGFRHVVIGNYGGFDPGLVRPAVQAARCLADELTAVVAVFRQSVDPE